MLRSILASTLLALVSTAAMAVSLPLSEGEFTSGKCDLKALMKTDPTESIGVYNRGVGELRSSQFLIPGAEDKPAYCTIRGTRVVGVRYTGKAACRSTGKDDSFEGFYLFDYEILDARTFISKGVTYRWCVPHR